MKATRIVLLIVLLFHTVTFAARPLREVAVAEFPNAPLLAPFAVNGQVGVATLNGTVALFDGTGAEAARVETGTAISAAGASSNGSIFVSGSVGLPLAGLSIIKLRPGLTGVDWSSTYFITNPIPDVLNIPKNARPISVNVPGEDTAWITGDYKPGNTSEDFFMLSMTGGNAQWLDRGVGLSSQNHTVGSVMFQNSSLYTAGHFSRLSGEGLVAIKSNVDGTRAWTYIETNAYSELPKALAVDAEGNVIIVGSHITDIFAPARDMQTMVVKISADGVLLWRALLNGSAGDETALGVATDASNNIYVTGTTGTVKYSAAGELIWQSEVPGEAIALHNEDGVVAGTRSNADGSSEVRTAVLDDRGRVSSEARYEVSGGDAELGGLYVGANGIISVTVNASGTGALVQYSLARGKTGRGQR